MHGVGRLANGTHLWKLRIPHFASNAQTAFGRHPEERLNIPPFQKREGCPTRKGSRVRLCRNHKRTAEYSAGYWAAQNC
jgi:hypothetical protein